MAAPQLRLDVSLNLVGFRNEIQKLTRIAQSEFAPKIDVKFNRQTLTSELNNLERAIKQRTYRVEIGGNVDKLPGKIKALKEQLASLEAFKIDLGVGAVKSLSKKDASKIKSDVRLAILGEDKKILVPVSITPRITKDDIRNFKNAVKSKLTGLSVDVKANVKGGGPAGLPPDFMKYMAEQGLLGKTASGMTMRMGKDSGDIKQQLSDAVQSAEKIKSVFDGVAKSIATTGKSIANVQGKRLGLANVPLMAGAVERRVEKAVAAIGKTTSFSELKDLYPAVNRTVLSLATLTGQIQQNTSKLSGFSLIIGLAAFAGVPLAKSIVKLTGSADKFSKLLDRLGPQLEAAFTESASNILKTASGRLLTGGNVAGLLPAAYRGIRPAAEPAGLLPPAYRGIGPSRNAGSLPGTAFAGQKYLPTALGNELKEILQGAANAFRDSIRQTIRTVTVEDLGRVGQKAIAGSRVAGYLPPIARFGEGRTPSPYSAGRLGREGETRAELFARREREARMRSALRGVDIMGEGGMMGRAASPYSRAYRAARPQSAIVPYAAGGALVYKGPSEPRGTGAGPGDFAGRAGGLGKFTMPKLPGAGLVREIGEEFAFATKQVLLYGQAYKLLGFAQAFPAQVGEAVGALQSFRNTLNAISPTAQEAAASSEFVLNIVDKYNVPLQSARDGFTKLYASMAPTGFSGNEIRDLFSGISKAAATFGMSSNKVDRVTYAFAQMASKGQVMSEELKGQLGDVLPGAMGIFAKAAGFEGADAIQKFSKALEDGAYKGKPMRDLLKNVTIELNKEFGPGAEGAARTYQGVMNRMANSTRLFYESFEPVAVGFLNSVVMPITSGIKTVTDGFNAFFTGTLAKTAGGAAFAQQLNSLKPSFEGIGANLAALIPSFQTFGRLLLSVAQFLTQLAGNPITGFLLKVYTNVLLVNTAFTLLGGKILISLVSGINAAIARFVALNVAVATMQRTTVATNSTLAGTQLQMALLQKSAGMATGPVIMLRNALMSIARIGLIAVGINVVINGLTELDRLKQSLAEIGTFSSAKYRKEVSSMTKEDVNSRLIENRRTQQAIQKELTGYAGPVGSTKGLVTGRDEELRARLLVVQTKEQELIRANRTAKAAVSLESQVAGGIVPITGADGSGGGSKGAKGAKLDAYDRSRLDFIQQQAEQEQLALDRRRQQNVISETRYKIDSAALALDVAKLAEAEKLRLATMATNKDNLSAQDKQLKLADLQIAYANNLAIAQDKYTVAVEGAKKELEGPFQSAIDSANLLMVEQQMLLGNLQDGIGELTPDQQSYLQALGLAKGMSEDEILLLKDKIALMRGVIEKQLALNNEVKREQTLRGLRNQLALARTLDPKAELREQIRQESPFLTSGQVEEQASLQEQVNAAGKTKEQLQGIASSIGDAFGNAFKGIITGSMTAQQALAGFFQSVADSFADMVAKMIAEYLKMALIKGIMSIIGGIPGSLGGGGENLGANSSAVFGLNSADMTQYSPLLPMAKGGVLSGGFQAFANGGIVTGPTLGLVGEGRYNEAVIPLPDGKSVPVDLGGAASNQMNTNITVNVNNGQAQSNATGSNSSELGRKIEGAVKQVIVGELRPGGLLASR